jgi:NADH dehydrogenase (ubiquinone) 1 alpha subcomplex subunit 8
MNTAQEGQDVVDRTPMPSHIPHVDEVGATSAPLKSAAFFIGAYCKEFNGSFCAILREKRIIILILLI